MEEERRYSVRLAACIVAGRFNPAIIQPDWVVREGILTSETVEVAQLLGSTGIVQFRMEGIMWQAGVNRLEVHAERDDVNPSEFVVAVLGRLPHTPIFAVGNNFHLEITDPQQGLALYPKVIPSVPSQLLSREHALINQSAIFRLTHKADCVAQVAFEAEQQKVIVATFNFNRDCSSSKAAIQAAELWQVDRDEAYQLVESLLG